MKYPYRFRLKKLGKEKQISYQIFLTQNRKLKEKIASYSENVFSEKKQTFLVYDGPRLKFWLSKGARRGRGLFLNRILFILLKSATFSK